MKESNSNKTKLELHDAVDDDDDHHHHHYDSYERSNTKQKK